uniref:Uncharacterized protein n=1 Tax=Myoviridae sp. ctQYc56 TaxID=2825100 RepID=A0A8S5Q015_9CAUD|nr:MAG TPA: hypothetical protein [Myoviridae sp. ctQYc56]
MFNIIRNEQVAGSNPVTSSILSRFFFGKNGLFCYCLLFVYSVPSFYFVIIKRAGFCSALFYFQGIDFQSTPFYHLKSSAF